ncbi:hypothetical protein EYZ11_011849 [Aspergillus tanneri]|uniref:Uncharacterized protein n=1 Tax=Aspergillus tanneri TaxID=1220188 RepID=A0A4S3J1Q8_9EURO|nr:hypothetical protein EYZ11_011849 [Aspergillus tanneri]
MSGLNTSSHQPSGPGGNSSSTISYQDGCPDALAQILTSITQINNRLQRLENRDNNRSQPRQGPPGPPGDRGPPGPPGPTANGTLGGPWKTEEMGYFWPDLKEDVALKQVNNHAYYKDINLIIKPVVGDYS